ncbi:MAG: hypothetical protein SGPRY_011542, partial [Prymnesium sp.]
MRTEIVFARAYLKPLKLAREQIKYLCEEAIRSGVQGNRGELFAVEVARAHAALNGNDRIESEDLQMGVRLCIAPRGTEIQAPPDDEMMVPEEFMFDVEGVALDADVMKFANKAKTGRSGSRGMIFSEERGRYIKPILPKGKVRKLAAKRRERALESGDPKQMKKNVFIEGSDVRAKKMARKAGSLVIFVVDASGSMALNRMVSATRQVGVVTSHAIELGKTGVYGRTNAAKGAAVNLLGEAYQSRDKICLISFQGEFAQVLLPPTRSIAMAKNRLERMPCGGGSPLAHALNQAAQVGMTAQKSGDVGEVLVVCISDGRANVPLSVSVGESSPEDPPMGKNELKEEVLNTAKVLGMLPNFKLLMLDTENKFVSTGVAKEIAAAAQGKYHYIPKASEKAIGQ